MNQATTRPLQAQLQGILRAYIDGNLCVHEINDEGMDADEMELIHHLAQHLRGNELWPYDVEKIQQIIGHGEENSRPFLPEFKFLLGLSLGRQTSQAEMLGATPVHQFLQWTQNKETIFKYEKDILSFLQSLLLPIENVKSQGVGSDFYEDEVDEKLEEIPSKKNHQGNLLSSLQQILHNAQLTDQIHEVALELEYDQVHIHNREDQRNNLEVLENWLLLKNQLAMSTSAKNLFQVICLFLRRIFWVVFELGHEPIPSSDSHARTKFSLSKWSREFPMITWAIWRSHPFHHFRPADFQAQKHLFPIGPDGDFWKSFLSDSLTRPRPFPHIAETLQQKILLLKTAFSLVAKGETPDSRIKTSGLIIKIMENFMNFLHESQQQDEEKNKGELQEGLALQKLESRIVRFYSQSLLQSGLISPSGHRLDSRIMDDHKNLLVPCLEKMPNDFNLAYSCYLLAHKNDRRPLLNKLTKILGQDSSDEKKRWDRFSPSIFTKYLFFPGSRPAYLKSMRNIFFVSLSDKEKCQTLDEMTQSLFLSAPPHGHRGQNQDWEKAQMANLTSFYKVFYEESMQGDPFHHAFTSFLTRAEWGKFEPEDIRKIVQKALQLHSHSLNKELMDLLTKFIFFVLHTLGQERAKTTADSLIPMPQVGRGIFTPTYLLHFLMAIPPEIARKWQDKMLSGIKEYFHLFFTCFRNMKPGHPTETLEAVWDGIFIRMKEIFILNKATQTMLQDMKGKLVFGPMDGGQKSRDNLRSSPNEQLGLWS